MTASRPTLDQGDKRALLVALIGDAILTGLDSLRVELGPTVERRLIEHVVDHLECAGYELAPAHVSPVRHEPGGHRPPSEGDG